MQPELLGQHYQLLHPDRLVLFGTTWHVLAGG
jgi:hypothetical protein